MIADPITDMLNRIRNAQAVFKETVDIPWSKMKYQIAKILEQNGFVEKVEKKGRHTKKIIRITLRYEKENPVLGTLKPAIRGLRRISTPGRRIYRGYKDLRGKYGQSGILIVSTSKGLMTDKEAKKQKVGGEVIAEIW